MIRTQQYNPTAANIYKGLFIRAVLTKHAGKYFAFTTAFQSLYMQEDPNLVTSDDFLRWREGAANAFDVCKKKLLRCEGPLAEKLLVKYVRKRSNVFEQVTLGNPDYTRLAAIEDLDAKVSGGCCAVDTTGRGKYTRRKLKLGQE